MECASSRQRIPAGHQVAAVQAPRDVQCGEHGFRAGLCLERQTEKTRLVSFELADAGIELVGIAMHFQPVGFAAIGHRRTQFRFGNLRIEMPIHPDGPLVAVDHDLHAAQ